MSDTEPAIQANCLRRIYTKRRLGRVLKEIVAVDEISLQVRQGMIFGMLGPNGAGKTTTIKMLSTLLTPTAGSATVAGFDVVKRDREVRKRLGVVLGGDRGLYGKLTARDNLIYFGHLYGMHRSLIRRAADEKLDMVGLLDRADERVEGYSRGMKQRVHLAKALIHDPPILILDEPTIGLDPAAAIELRKAILALVPDHTVLLTTHDMTEADSLCEEIAIVDQGLIVAQGSPAALKARVAGSRRIVIESAEVNGHLPEVEFVLERIDGVSSVSHGYARGGSEWTVLCNNTTVALDHALGALRDREISVRAVRVIEPTLEDVFLSIAGKSYEEDMG